MLFRKIILVYTEKLIKPTNTLCGQNEKILMLKHVGQVTLSEYPFSQQGCELWTSEYAVGLRLLTIIGLLQ
jgi:hypothetical protein